MVCGYDAVFSTSTEREDFIVRHLREISLGVDKGRLFLQANVTGESLRVLTPDPACRAFTAILPETPPSVVERPSALIDALEQVDRARIHPRSERSMRGCVLVLREAPETSPLLFLLSSIPFYGLRAVQFEHVDNELFVATDDTCGALRAALTQAYQLQFEVRPNVQRTCPASTLRACGYPFYIHIIE